MLVLFPFYLAVAERETDWRSFSIVWGGGGEQPSVSTGEFLRAAKRTV